VQARIFGVRPPVSAHRSSSLRGRRTRSCPQRTRSRQRWRSCRRRTRRRGGPRLSVVKEHVTREDGEGSDVWTKEQCARGKERSRLRFAAAMASLTVPVLPDAGWRRSLQVPRKQLRATLSRVQRARDDVLRWLAPSTHRCARGSCRAPPTSRGRPRPYSRMNGDERADIARMPGPEAATRELAGLGATRVSPLAALEDDPLARRVERRAHLGVDLGGVQVRAVDLDVAPARARRAQRRVMRGQGRRHRRLIPAGSLSVRVNVNLVAFARVWSASFPNATLHPRPTPPPPPTPPSISHQSILT
jgi:hypothetical protein